MRKQFKKIVAAVTMGCVLSTLVLTGCTDTSNKQTVQEDPDRAYIVSESSRTTNSWAMNYGVITADGRMVIPMDSHEISIISDSASGEQLWIQTITRVVDDPNLTAEQLNYDYNYWEKVHNNYTLYDLDGNVIKELGEDGIYTVCDNFIMGYNGKVVHRDTWEPCFEDTVYNIKRVGDRYVMQCNDYNSVRVTDLDLNVLYETEGSYTMLNGEYYIVKRVEGKGGLCDLDGNEIIPCNYGYFYSNYNIGVPYVTSSLQTEYGNAEVILSLETGEVIYQESGKNPDYDYIQYLLEDGMILQTREQVGVNPWGGYQYQYYTQMYDYDGNPLTERYRYLYPEIDLYKQALAKSDDAELIFNATTLDGEKQILNDKFEVIYTVPMNESVTLLSNERMIKRDSDYRHAALYTLDGQKLTEKDYGDGLYRLHSMSGNDYLPEDVLAANYELAGTWLYDIIDLDGNIVLEKLKSVTMLSENRFWVEKGFSQGLMDREGNWIYEQSVFDSSVDE